MFSFVELKKIIGISLLLIIMIPLLSKGGFFIWFKMNQEEIAKTLCINKNTEKSESCKGCCYLDKTLDKLDESNSDSEQKDNKVKVTQDEIIAISNEKIQLIDLKSQKAIFAKYSYHTATSVKSILDPPPRF